MAWTLFWDEQPGAGILRGFPIADAPLEIYTLILSEMVEQRPETFPLIASAFHALTVEHPEYRSDYDYCERLAT